MNGIEKSKHNTKGFTAIELLIAMSVFVTIIGIAVSGFVRILGTQRAIATLVSVNSNASLALEQMMREMRTGNNFNQIVIEGGDITFYNAKGDLISYRRLVNSDGRGLIERTVTTLTGTEAGTITAENVDIRSLQFILFGHLPGDGYPPRVTVVMEVAPVGIRYIDAPVVHLQTTVSAREWDQ